MYVSASHSVESPAYSVFRTGPSSTVLHMNVMFITAGSGTSGAGHSLTLGSPSWPPPVRLSSAST